MPHAMDDATDATLAAQYEAFPYPRRDPREEASRLVIGSPSHLREIDHWVFAARRPRDVPLRALVAGGGTGDAAIMLAAQMARDGRPGRVTYLDRSAAATAVARARAAARGLELDWRHGSLLDLPDTAIGPFDYIDCVGVLHHLPDPAAGLAALVSVLAPGGGMGLMVYAPHGRNGVYMLQDALRRLAPPTLPPTARLDLARRLMAQLPASAPLRANRSVTDHLAGGDAGLYDLLLNPRDQAFTITRLLDLLADAGLAATCLLEPARYDPALLLSDAKLRAAASALPATEWAQLAEDLSGAMSTHVVYCVRANERPEPPDAMAPEAVPIMREMPGEALARLIRADGVLPVVVEGDTLAVPLPPLAGAILRLIDGQRSVAGIYAALTARGIPAATAERAWREVAGRLVPANRVLFSPAAT